MSVSAYPRSSHIGFLGLCEGPLLGLYAGWWLHLHGRPPMVFFGAGVAISCAYYLILNAGRDSALGTPIVLLSMAIWGFVGWNLGALAFQMFGLGWSGGSVLDRVVAWKIGTALLFAFIAFGNKAVLSGAR